MNKNEKALRRIRGLLAQAEDPAATAEEAAAFSAKAEELIARYAIDTALLGDADPAVRGTPTTAQYEQPSPYRKPKATLLACVAGAYGCTVVDDHRLNKLVVVGFPSDLALVDVLYTSLITQGLNGSLRGDRSFRTAYWYGFAARVGERLTEARAAAGGAEPGAGLVLADRDAEVADRVGELYPQTRTRKVSVRHGDGFVSGVNAGDRADLGTQRFEGSRTAIG